MNNFKKIKNRSDSYQVVLLEISYPHELLDIFPDNDSIYKKLNPFSYNDDIAELQEQLNKELWRIIEDNLTDRQKQVVKLYASGKTQIEIAKILGVNQSSITKCLAGDTMLHFVDKNISIANLWNIWANNPSNVQEMQILSLNEDTMKVFSNTIVEVMQNSPKELISFTTVLNKTMRASEDHEFLTPHGWKPLIDIIETKNPIAITTDNYDNIKFDKIISSKSDGKEITYDIQVTAPYHNFVANDIITKNCINGNVDYKNKDSKGKPITYGGVRLKLQKIVKEDVKVNEILQKIADIRDNDPF